MFKLGCRHWITSLSLIAVAWSSPAAAGSVRVVAPSCVDTASGGYCVGTFKGARASSDPNFGVELISEIDANSGNIRPTLTFIATFTKNGVSSKRICSANNDWTGFAQTEGLGAVLRAENYFYVSWDSTGTCTDILIASESSEI